MIRNESNPDRIVRGVIGVLCAVGAISATGLLSGVLGALAVVMVVTATVGFCPMYRLLGIATAPFTDP